MCDPRNSKVRLHMKNYDTKMTYNLTPNIISSNDMMDVIFNVESLCVPKTYYNVIEKDPIIFINSVVEEIFLNIEPGNYTLDDFFTMLTNQMNVNDQVANYSYSQNTQGKIVITSDSLSSFSLQIVKPLTSRYTGAILDKPYTSVSSNIIFDNVPNMERTDNFIIESNLTNLNSTSYDNIESSDLETKNNLLAVLPCMFQQSELSDVKYHRSYYGNYSSHYRTGPSFNTVISVELKDDTLTPIDLNGSYWTMNLFVQVNF